MNLHALVIEPDAAQRRIVRDTLDCDGWNVAEARSAEEAVGAIESCPWSLIFCDMSERDKGLALLRDLKTRLGDAVPVVMIAAHGTPHTVLEAILNGALDLITKPCREQEVRERSRFVIGRLQAAARETGCRREEETTIRELENVVRAAVTCSLDGAVYAMDLLPRIESGTRVTAESLEDKVKEFKLRMVKETLEKHHGNVTRAASALGITRPSLYKMLKELNNENLP